MAVTDKLKGVVEELRHDLNEVKDQVKELLPLKKTEATLKNGVLKVTMPKLEGRQNRGRRISIGTDDT